MAEEVITLEDLQALLESMERSDVGARHYVITEQWCRTQGLSGDDMRMLRCRDDVYFVEDGLTKWMT